MRKWTRTDSRARRWAVAVGMALVPVALAAGLWAAAPVGAGARPAPAKPSPEENNDIRFQGGATLQTDSDVDGLIRKSDEYVQDGKFAQAVLVLQHIMDQFGSVLSSKDRESRIYLPVREEVERMLAALPEEGLSAYRLTADGEAKGILAAIDAGDRDEEEGLSLICRRFFISSVGDDAAFRLACLKMDRFQFVHARSLLRRILDVHPDYARTKVEGDPFEPRPSLERAAVLTRLVIASARESDAVGARKALEELAQINSPTLRPEHLALLRRQVELAGQAARLAAAAPEDWTAFLGTPNRHGVMNDLAPSLHQGESRLTFLWELGVHPDKDWMAPAHLRAMVQPRYDGAGRVTPAGGTRAQVASRWEANGWFPTSQVLLYDHRVYFKTNTAVTCLDMETGKMVFSPPDADDLAKVGPNRGYYYSGPSGTANDPVTAEEVLFFGDRLQRQLAIWDNVLYYIEGVGNLTPYDRRGSRMYGLMPLVGPSNRLTARDARNGKLKWQLLGSDAPPAPPKPRGQDEEPEPAVGEQRIVSMPVPVGDRVVVAVEDNDAVYLLALSPNQTQTLPPNRTAPRVLWKTFLCSGPQDGGFRWSPLCIAAEGSEVFVATGRGVVMALDATDGSVRWASRYERPEVPTGPARFGPMATGRNPQTAGFDDDTLIIHGGHLLVMSNDSKDLLVLKRYSGELAMRLPSASAAGSVGTTPRYCLGATADALYLAASDAVRKIGIPSGKLMWVAPVGRMTGRGILTEGSVYVPTKDRILRIDGKTGKQSAVFRVTNTTGDPIGNLHTDGFRIFIAGMERVYAVMDASQRLALLDAQVERDDERSLEARLLRARMLRSLGRVEPAVADLRVVYAKGALSRKEDARRMLLDSLVALASGKPEDSDGLLEEAGRLATEAVEKVQINLARAASHARGGRVEQAAELYLAVSADRSGAMVSPSGDTTGGQVLAARLAAQGLQDLAGRHPEQVARLLEARSGQALESARQAGDLEALLAVLEAYPGTRASVLAGRAASALARERQRLELAEAIVSGMARASNQPTAAAGLAGLAALHQELGWRRQAAAEWRLLADRFAEVEVPAGPALAPAGQVAAEALAKLPAADVQDPDAGRLPAPPWTQLWKEEQWGPCLRVDLPGDPASQFNQEHVLVHSLKDRRLYLKNLSSGKVVWPLTLSVGQGNSVQRDGRLCSVGGTFFPGGQLVGDQQVGLIWDDLGNLKAVGLLTGKELWSKPSGREASSLGSDQTNAYTYNTKGVLPVAAGAGVVAQHVVDGTRVTDTVRVFDSITGELLWNRAFDRQAVDGVAVAGGSVCVVSNDGREVQVLDRLTGRRLHQLKLEDRQPGQVLWTEGGLVYPTARGAAFRGLGPEPASWEIDCGAGARLGLLSEGLLYALNTTGDQVQVVSLDGGKVRLTARADDRFRAINDVGLSPDGSELALTGVVRDAGGGDRAAARFHEMATGKTLALVVFSQPQPLRISAASLARCHDRIPMLVAEGAAASPRGRRPMESFGSGAGPELAVPPGRYSVQFLERHSGKLSGDNLPLPHGGKIDNLNQAPLVAGKTLVFFNDKGLYVFGRAPAAAAAAAPADQALARP